MPAWSQARRLGSQARAGAAAKRAAPAGEVRALPQAKERFEKQVCVYCCSSSGRKTGFLALTGPVFYCKNHLKQYKEDKEWETIHKRELGL